MARAQEPHPGGQGGGHVEHRLAGGQQLLGQQVAEAASGLDRPGPLPKWRGPVAQLIDLAAGGPHPHLRQLGLVSVDRHRGVRALVGIDADHHGHLLLRCSGIGAAVGTPDFGSVVLSHLS